MMKLQPGAVRPFSCVLFGALLVQFVLAHDATAQSFIDFEGISGAQVSTQYSDRGVTFNFPSLRDYSSTPGFARSGNAAIASARTPPRA